LKNKSDETVTAKQSFLEKKFNLIKIKQKCFADGFYKTQVRNCQLTATIRILPG